MGVLNPISLSVWLRLEEASEHGLSPLCLGRTDTKFHDLQDRDEGMSLSIWLLPPVESGMP